MIKFIVVHRNDINNVGDIASNPLQYFLKPDQYQVIDVVDLYKTEYPADVPIIVGGGGLLANDFMGDAIQRILDTSDKNRLLHLWDQRWTCTDPTNLEINQDFNKKYHALISEFLAKVTRDRAPRILWGAGHNGEITKKTRGQFVYPSWISEFKLAGIRDWGQSLPWVPCASCMSPALKKQYTIKNDVIFFEHKKQMIKDFGSESIPRFVNSGSNVDQTIELLGSANIILTNSYHGAYWGTLLKKRVIVVGPWSSKFYSLKHQPIMIDRVDQWRDVVDSCTVFDSAIDECVNSNLNFWANVVHIS